MLFLKYDHNTFRNHHRLVTVPSLCACFFERCRCEKMSCVSLTNVMGHVVILAAFCYSDPSIVDRCFLLPWRTPSRCFFLPWRTPSRPQNFALICCTGACHKLLDRARVGCFHALIDLEYVCNVWTCSTSSGTVRAHTMLLEWCEFIQTH